MANVSNLNHKLSLKEGWAIKSSTQVKKEGEVISTGKFSPDSWHPTSIPSTVLNTLVKNGIYPDPRLGMNNFLIPDASDDFNARYNLSRYSYLPDKRNPWKNPYWYRTEFKLPDTYKGKIIWLIFKGINYRADVWFNGNKVAHSKNMAGMFQRFKFNITDYAKPGENNYLAVKIYNVDYIGDPGPPQMKIFGPPRSYDREIHKDVTLKICGGWDCAPVVRDRNMGIWQDVYIEATGPIDIRYPHIITKLPLPETNLARLKISLELVNATNFSQKGILKGKIEGNIEFEKNVKISPQEVKKILFSPDDFPELIIDNPRLWWPNGYGQQNLYNLSLSFEIEGKISDVEETTFGIREVTNKMHELKGWYGRVFYINGKRVFCKGGWLQPEIMLNNDKKRCYDEARLIAEANLNMVASEDWPAPPDEFLDACDKYGLMYWETFYQCHCQYPGTPTENYPLEHDLCKRCVADIIKRYRNHPSLVLWCAANETTVCKELYEDLREKVIKLDGMRPFIPSSNISWNVDKLTPWIKKDTPVGVYDSGSSYCWKEPSYYYEKVSEGRESMFMDEIGSPSVPPISSLKKFIPNLGETQEGAPYPLNDVWAHHGAVMKEYFYSGYDRAIRDKYGPPNSVEDYVSKAQLVNANSYRAMFEAANHRLWDITSGILLWKLNSCWPTVIWQIYDWYLGCNASYYYTKKACQPLHVQLNLLDSSVSIINTHHRPEDNLEIIAKIYDFNMSLKWKESKKVSIGADQYKEIFTIPSSFRLELTPAYFLKLELRDEADNLLSDNFYWLSSKSPADFTKLRELPSMKLDVSCQIKKKDGEYIAWIITENPTKNLAFFIHLMITKGLGGEEVLPSFWEDNYFNLLPGEKRKVEVVFSAEDLGKATPVLDIKGWNVQGESLFLV